jgi:Flp pilus assembly protein TadB
MTADDRNNQESFDAESDGLREVHQNVHDSLADADPTHQEGKPLLLTGFILVIVLALLALLAVAVWVL